MACLRNIKVETNVLKAVTCKLIVFGVVPLGCARQLPAGCVAAAVRLPKRRVGDASRVCSLGGGLLVDLDTVDDGPDPADEEHGGDDLEDSVDEGGRVEAVWVEAGSKTCTDTWGEDVEEEDDDGHHVGANAHNSRVAHLN